MHRAVDSEGPTTADDPTARPARRAEELTIRVVDERYKSDLGNGRKGDWLDWVRNEDDN